jgi:riboflavin kinase/FMN adenylyltransferase
MREVKKGWDGLCNIGTRPTFTPHSGARHCEVFLLSARAALYGRKLRVVFLRKIRPEKRFATSEALRRQIAKDVRSAVTLSRLCKKGHFSI